MPNSNSIFQELHSEEVQEIISDPPNWLVHSGISLLFLFIIILGVGSCWVSYPDVITVPFVLNATDAPRTVVSHVDGRLIKILVKDGQRVDLGQNLAYLESAAKHEQILKLSGELELMQVVIFKKQWASVEKMPLTLYNNLGEVQNNFELFNQQLVSLKSYLTGGFYPEKKKLLVKDLEDLSEMNKVLLSQLDLQKRDFQLAKEEFAIQEKLFSNKVIAPLEYKREKAKLVSREIPISNLSSLLIQNHSQQTSKNKELLELENDILRHKSEFLQSLKTLQSTLHAWKQKYILTAPLSGRISFASPLQEQQFVGSSSELMTIEPQFSNLQGIVRIPQGNMGKLKIGQTVLIKLDGFPYKEYGLIEGVLSKISAIPGKDSDFWGYVSLPNKLTTRYNVTLNYSSGLKGQGEIVTSNRRLAERLFSVIKDGGK